MKTMIVLLCLAVCPMIADASEWTAYRSAPGHDGLDFRFKVLEFRYEGGQRQIVWQFRNRYKCTTKIRFKITAIKNGAEVSETGTLTIGSGEESSTSGQHTIAHSLKSMQVLERECVQS